MKFHKTAASLYFGASILAGTYTAHQFDTFEKTKQAYFEKQTAESHVEYDNEIAKLIFGSMVTGALVTRGIRRANSASISDIINKQ